MGSHRCGSSDAAELILAEAADISDEMETQVRGVFEEHGFVDCVRSRQWERFRTGQSRDRIPHVVEGAQSAGRTGLTEGVPAYKQFYVDVEADTPAVQLQWSVTARSSGFSGIPGGGGGGEASPLALSIRKGAAIKISYDPAMAITEDARYSPDLVDNRQRVVLTGDCLPEEGGRVHTLFLNSGQSALQVDQMDIELLDAVPEDGLVVGCAE